MKTSLICFFLGLLLGCGASFYFKRDIVVVTREGVIEKHVGEYIEIVGILNVRRHRSDILQVEVNPGKARNLQKCSVSGILMKYVVKEDVEIDDPFHSTGMPYKAGVYYKLVDPHSSALACVSCLPE